LDVKTGSWAFTKATIFTKTAMKKEKKLHLKEEKDE
jgi:hypothetical protein